MALTIHVPDPQAPMVTVRGLWLTADRQRVVKKGDREAAVALGNQITIAEAQRLGLLPGPESGPEHKMRVPSANKSAPAADG
jgi:hypothetical protein